MTSFKIKVGTAIKENELGLFEVVLTSLSGMIFFATFDNRDSAIKFTGEVWAADYIIDTADKRIEFLHCYDDESLASEAYLEPVFETNREFERLAAEDEFYCLAK